MSALQNLLIFLLLFPLIAESQSVSLIDSVIIDEAIVISSAKELRPAESLNRAITVIDATEIANNSMTSIDEVLKFAAGIDVQQRGNFGVQADITSRGSTFNQVLVLLDGVRLNDPLTGHFAGYFPIPLSEVSRIEIIRGASSGIYGTEAVGAVINIISKGRQSRQDSSLQSDIRLQAGSYNTRLGDGYIQYDSKLWSVGLGGAYRESDGHTPANDSLPYDFNLQTYSANFQYHPNSRLKAGLRYALDSRDFGARYFYTRSTFDLSRETVERNSAQAYVNYEINDKLIFRTNGGWMQTTDEFVFNPAFAANNHTTSLIDIHPNLYWGGSENLSYTFGAQWLQRDVESNDRGNHSISQYGVYVAQQWKMNNWSWQLSGRLENHDAFGWELVPQTSLGYSLKNIHISAFFGRAIRAADVTELYVSNNLEAVSPGRNLGNPRLGAESSWNSELSARASLLKGISLEFTAFHRQSSDLIDYVLTPANEIPQFNNIDPDGDYFFARNVSDLQTVGIDVQGSFDHEFKGNHKIGIDAGFLWADHLDDEASKYIAGSEGILLNSRLRYEHGRLQLALNSVYRERTSDAADVISRGLNSSYFLVDGSLSFEIYRLSSVTLNCRNLLNRTYADILGAQMPGRWWMLGMRFTL